MVVTVPHVIVSVSPTQFTQQDNKLELNMDSNTNLWLIAYSPGFVLFASTANTPENSWPVKDNFFVLTHWCNRPQNKLMIIYENFEGIMSSETKASLNYIFSWWDYSVLYFRERHSSSSLWLFFKELRGILKDQKIRKFFNSENIYKDNL